MQSLEHNLGLRVARLTPCGADRGGNAVKEVRRPFQLTLVGGLTMSRHQPKHTSSFDAWVLLTGDNDWMQWIGEFVAHNKRWTAIHLFC